MKILISMLFLMLTACAQKNENRSVFVEDIKVHSAGIVGGKEITAEDSEIASSLVFIQEVQSPTKAPGCTGTLITKRTVLLAAHCVRFAQFIKNPEVVYLYFSPTPLFGGGDTVRKPLKIISHISFGTQANTKDPFDLALIHLAEDAPAHAKPAFIANEIPEFLYTDSFLIAGYGKTVNFRQRQVDPIKLRSVEVPLLFSWLKNKYENRAYSDFFYFDQRSGKGACAGDSGGPAFFWNPVKSRWELVGVSELAFNLEDPFKSCTGASAYINILKHKDWILSNLK